MVFLVLAASPLSGQARPAPLTIADVDLPVPPVPPDVPPSDGAAAPLPDIALTAPDRPVVERGVTLSPGLFTARTRNLSDGFLGSSDAQTENEKKQRPIPGLMLSVPLR